MSADTIEVYCDDPSHEARRWVIDVLERGEHGWPPQDWRKSGRKRADAGCETSHI